MQRSLLLLIIATLFAVPAGSQETEEADEPGTDVEAVQPEPDEPAEPEEEPVDYDETGLDDQGFADEDDDFRPTEDIPTDQSIDFPTDI